MSKGTGTKTVDFLFGDDLVILRWSVGSAGPYICSALSISSMVTGEFLIAFEATRCLKSFKLGQARVDCNALAASAPLICAFVRESLLLATVDGKE